MAKKAKKPSSPAEIRKLAESGKLVMGTERAIKQLKQGKVKKVFITSNCPGDVRENVKRYARLSKVEVTELEIPNDELGVICKKPFSISIAGVVKE
jgi:large subunit ribosomal protein L30e